MENLDLLYNRIKEQIIDKDERILGLEKQIDELRKQLQKEQDHVIELKARNRELEKVFGMLEKTFKKDGTNT